MKIDNAKKQTNVHIFWWFVLVDAFVFFLDRIGKYIWQTEKNTFRSRLIRSWTFLNNETKLNNTPQANASEVHKWTNNGL
jgi:hypothetical protein